MPALAWIGQRIRDTLGRRKHAIGNVAIDLGGGKSPSSAAARAGVATRFVSPHCAASTRGATGTPTFFTCCRLNVERASAVSW
jgi:hypothetical protein